MGLNSALDIFGGTLVEYRKLVELSRSHAKANESAAVDLEVS